MTSSRGAEGGATDECCVRITLKRLEVVGLRPVAARHDHQLHGSPDTGECGGSNRQRVQALEGAIWRPRTRLRLGLRRRLAAIWFHRRPNQRALAVSGGAVSLVAGGHFLRLAYGLYTALLQ